MAFLEFIPLIAFFISYKLYDIYHATAVLMIATAVSILIIYLIQKTVSKSQLALLGVAIVMGGLTLAFQDKRFIMYKPSIVQWVMALVIIGSHAFNKPVLKLMLGKILNLPNKLWWKVSLVWGGYLIASGFLNIFIAQTMSEEAWINFKVFGNTAANITMILGTFIVLRKYLVLDDEEQQREQ